MAAPSTYVKNSTMGSLTVKDATGTPVTLVVAYDRGDLAISGMGAKLNEVNHVQRRGKHLCSVSGARKYPTCTMSIWVSNLVGSSAVAPGSLLEFLTFLSSYSANTNPAGTGRPACVNFVYTIEGTNFGDSADETVTVTQATVMGFDFAEGLEGNTLTIQFEICGTITIANSTGSVALAEIS